MSSDPPLSRPDPAITPPDAERNEHYWYEGSQNRARLVLESMRRYRVAELGMEERARAATGLGNNDLAAMRYLLRQRRAGDHVTPAALAEYLGITRASVTVMLGRLAGGGHIRRRRAHEDRRSTHLIPREPTDGATREMLVDTSDAILQAADLASDDAAVVSGFLRDLRVAVEAGAWRGREMTRAAPEPAAIATPADPAAPGGPVGDGRGAGTEAATLVLDALRDYRSTEQRMRRRTGESMRMGENDLRALRFLIRRRGEQIPVTAADLAAELAMKSSSVSVMLDRLSASGHVDRQPHPTDRRSVVVIATPVSDSEVRDTLGSMHATMIDVASGLSEHDCAVVEHFLAAMTDAVSRVGVEH